jgi:hypothetical protein
MKAFSDHPFHLLGLQGRRRQPLDGLSTRLSCANMKGNYYFSFILECSSASPEVVQVYASIVHDHDDDVHGHDSDVHDDDGNVDGVVYNSVARYTDRHSEDSHSNMMVAQ